MMDGAQFATAMAAVMFSAAILVSSHLFLGSTRTAAAAATIVAEMPSAQRTANAVWIRRARGR